MKHVRLLIYTGIIYISGCSTGKIVEKEEFTLAPYEITIKQRRSESIKVLGDHIFLHIDDITRGQTFVKLNSEEVEYIRTKVMKPGDIISFKYSGSKVFLIMTELHNFAFSGDYCVFSLSTIKPTESQIAKIKKDNLPASPPDSNEKK
ncbi:MAG: hypothetical protein HRT89_18540 [Lentisphaeria bacterium]|nr:hypothetical protein [Lentisphaeria bacterium]NQZ70056.1 hypothetical protein [Lentisphaeria bacterium]